MSLSPNQVRSFQYVIAPNIPFASALELVRQSSADLIILGNYPLGTSVSRTNGDALSEKLVVGYIDTGEYTGSFPKSLLGTIPPGFFGEAVPGYHNLYSVQFWQPQWRAVIYAQIDDLIAGGYDGVFLDVLDAFTTWLPGNSRGNVPYANVAQEQANLLADIRRYVDGKHLAKPFYLIGNNPNQIEQAVPGALGNLDVIFNESLTYTQAPNDGTVSIPSPYFSSMPFIQKLYAGHLVFGNDYVPLTNSDELFKSFSLNVSYGWVPSVTTPLQTPAIMTSGPMMFAATFTNPIVKGAVNLVNFIAGGTAPEAVLTGGDKNDFFIGGPGNNVISAGAGNDVIYAHPENAALKGILEFRFFATNKNATTPSVSVLINGKVVIPSTAITAADASNAQEFKIDITSVGAISSLKIVVTDTSYKDQNNFSNVSIAGVSLNGQGISIATANFPNGAYNSNFNYSNSGEVTIPASALNVSPPYLEKTNDTIDGGSGLDTVVYRATRNKYFVSKQANGNFLITATSTAEGPDTLINVERLNFTDKNLALDLGGNAGQVVKILGAVFGKSAVANKEYVGIGLDLLDKGMSYDTLAGLALNAAKATTNDQIVNTLWTNVIGSAPSAADKAPFIKMLEDGMTPGALAHIAADTSYNTANINLVGLAQTGIEYTPVA